MNKQQRRRRRLIRRLCTTLILIIIAVTLTITIPRIKKLRMFRGDYVRSVDVTDRIVASAAVWLKDVEGADIDAGWVRTHTDGISVQADLNFDPQGLAKGSFAEMLDEEAYSRCVDEAYALACECLRELIIKRLVAVGYAEELSDEEADALITEALGMPLEAYVKNAGVLIAPDRSELSGEIDRSGDYRIHGNIIEWTRVGVQVSDAFSVTSDSISIPGTGFIYVRAAEQEDGAEDQ